ncbi:MAG: UbiD family decarboxylase [Pirellulaceae bacterium]
MGYRSTRQCVEDLKKHDQLIVLDEPVLAHLQIAEIQRRVFANQGPAVLFTNVSDSRFPMVSNLFGTMERARFLFRDTIEAVRRAIELKIDPSMARRKPGRYWKAPMTALAMRPKFVRSAAITKNKTSIDQLPQLVSWPMDAGGFVTLPQVYSEDARRPGMATSNLGMYRIQLTGNQYETNRQIGLHYQIHRSIGVHHTAAREMNQPFRVNIFVGGSPAMTLAAVMPLPEGMSELGFAGALAGHRIPMLRQDKHLPIYADADFCISGTVDPDRLLPEGPFGDHLGYYSLAHDFPVLKVDAVYHRDEAIWPFTVVGRPPQEDTMFGELIHELTGPIIPTVLPGVKGVHAVDASGVHPLLLAIGSERYVPWKKSAAPQELLTQAHAILGQGQLSLAKYLMIVDQACDPQLDIHDIEAFFRCVFSRIDWARDLHFHTRTTIDTLDYSGSGFNEGSKLVMAATGPPVRELAGKLPEQLDLPSGFSDPRMCLPGVLAVKGPEWAEDALWLEQLEPALRDQLDPRRYALVAVVDDAEFCQATLNNFLWTVFTRSNPARDVFGVDSFVDHKHWGCQGPLVIDARIKPQHAPPLVEDPETNRLVDALASRGGPLARYL